jgi:hypothetical protein
LTTRFRGQRIRVVKWTAVAAGILSCVVTGSTVLSAQLGDVARKEAERRKTVQSSGKTYTNDNIKPDPSPSIAPSSDAPAASSSSSSASDKSADKSAADKSADKPGDKSADGKGAADKTDKSAQVSADPAERKKEEAQWRERIQNERDLLDRSKSFAEALQSRINALNTDFVNRDDPQQRAKIAADRDKALSDLDRTKKEIEEHTKNIAKIQDDARRAGAPAGWVR